jgi:hypothetical protein
MTKCVTFVLCVTLARKPTTNSPVKLLVERLHSSSGLVPLRLGPVEGRGTVTIVSLSWFNRNSEEDAVASLLLELIAKEFLERRGKERGRKR